MPKLTRTRLPERTTSQPKHKDPENVHARKLVLKLDVCHNFKPSTSHQRQNNQLPTDENSESMHKGVENQTSRQLHVSNKTTTGTLFSVLLRCSSSPSAPSLSPYHQLTSLCGRQRWDWNGRGTGQLGQHKTLDIFADTYIAATVMGYRIVTKP